MFEETVHAIKTGAAELARFEEGGGLAGWLGVKAGEELRQAYKEVSGFVKEHPARATAEALFCPALVLVDSEINAHCK